MSSGKVRDIETPAHDSCRLQRTQAWVCLAAAACVLTVATTASHVVLAAPNPVATNTAAASKTELSTAAAEEGFKPVGNTVTTYDGGILLTVAYMVFFLLLFAWVASLWRGQTRMDRKADALDAKLDKLAHAAATSPPSSTEANPGA